MGRNLNLLVEMFHRGGTENDEEAYSERGLLEGNCLIRLEEYGVTQVREKTDDEKQLDK